MVNKWFMFAFVFCNISFHSYFHVTKPYEVSAFFASPLSWIFDDPANTGWNEPDDSGEMLGNGFAW